MNNSSIHQFLMKHAPFLALFFIVEYTLSFAVIQFPVLALLLLPMKFVTPFLLYWFIKKLRNQELGGVIRGLHAWTYGVQLMLFAGLIEAAFIFVYHSVIDPDAAAVSMVWSYVGEMIFNMLVLVGTVKMADRVVREMMGL